MMLMKKTITVVCILQLAFLKSECLLAQAPVIEWEHSYGGSNNDDAFSVRQTTDGGFIAVGSATSYDGDVTGLHGNGDMWVLRIDNGGSIRWQKCFGGSSIDDGHSIVQTPDGGYCALGMSQSIDGDVTGNHGIVDFWLARIDSGGSLLWQKSLGGSGNDYAYGLDNTSDGGFILSGSSRSSDGDVSINHGNEDYWIVKTDSAGGIEWEKSFGGTGPDRAQAAHQTRDGGYIVAGFSNSSDGDVAGNHGAEDGWILKLDATGGIQWQKSIGGTNGDGMYDLRQTTDSGYIVSGYSYSNDGDVSGLHGTDDCWVVKLDSVGNIEWQHPVGGTGYEYGYAAEQASNGGYIVAGGTTSNNGEISGNHSTGNIPDWNVVKLDEYGVIEWQLCLGGTAYDDARWIEQSSDGGFIVAGNSKSDDGDISGHHSGTNTSDFWIVKLSPEPVSANDHPNKIVELTATMISSTILNLTFSSGNIGERRLTIADIAGRILYVDEIQATSGVNKKEIEVGDLAKGIYIVTLSGNEWSNSAEVMK